MTREEAKTFIKTNFGIDEPTDEMITNFLNTHNKEVQKEKDNAEKFKEKAKLADDLQKQLDKLNESNLSEVEKANKAVEASNNMVAKLEKEIAVMKRKTALAEKGITGDVADKLFAEDGSLDIEVFGQILADREKQAKEQTEKDLLGRTPDPDEKGDKGGSDDKNDPLVKSVIESISNGNKQSSDIINAYK